MYATGFTSDKELAKDLKLDSLTFLTIEEFKEALGLGVDTSDFDGTYPIPFGKKEKASKKIAFQLQQAL